MKKILAVILGASLALSGASAYSQAPAQKQLKLSIERQALRDALNDWAQQTGFQLVSEITGEFVAPRVEGMLTPEAALERLLAGTPLTYEWLSNRVVAIRNKDHVVSRAAWQSIGSRREPPTLYLAKLAANDAPARRRAAVIAPSSASRGSASTVSSSSGNGRVEEIIVTGTHIRGGAMASPSIRLDRDDIQRSGAATIQQLLERLPQNFAGGIAENTTTSFVPGDDEANNLGFGAGLNLRGLGNDATLVLLNGHRLSQTGAGNFIDVSQIPLSAIERIDVVTDGASAIYGSDAVAGVVNIVLRDEYDGAETGLRYGSIADGGPAEYSAQQTLGSTWNAGNVLLTYDFFDRGNLSRDDRSFAAQPVGDLLPDQRRHSALASVSQRISDDIKVSMDGLYSTRHSRFLAPLTFASLQADALNDSQSDALAVNAGIEAALPGSLAASVSGLYSRSDVDWTRHHLLDQQAPDRESFENGLWSFQAQVNGDVLQLPAGTVKAVVGAGYRQESFLDTVGVGPPRIDAERNVRSAFGEVRIPIVGTDNRATELNSLEVSLAARYEDYSDVGSSTNPKIGLLWQPLGFLNLRSTYSTSFRAPNFNQSSSFLDSVFLVDFPDSNASGSSLALFLAGADPDIAPEESTQWTIGADFSPSGSGGLNASVTYFDIEFKGRVATPSAAIFDLLTGGEMFAPVVTRNPDPGQIAAALSFAEDFTDLGTGRSPSEAEVIIDNRQQNIGRTVVRGVDLNVSYAFESDVAGQWRAFVSGSKLLTFENRITPTAAANDVVDTLFHPVDLRVRGGIDWSRGPWSASISGSYSGDYRNNTAVPISRVGAWTTVDLSARYQILSSAALGFLSKTSVRLSVLNLLDEDPPRVISPSDFVLPTGYDPANANPLGRVVALQVTKTW